MPTSRYVTLVPVRHNGIDFPAGTPIALSDEYANPLKLTGAIAPQAGALPSMPTVPGAVLREQLDSGTGSTNKRYLEIATSSDGRVASIPGVLEKSGGVAVNLATAFIDSLVLATATGLAITSAGWKTTDYMPVGSLTPYTASLCRYLCWYNSSKTKIGTSIDQSSNPYSGMSPAGAAYARLTVSQGATNVTFKGPDPANSILTVDGEQLATLKTQIKAWFLNSTFTPLGTITRNAGGKITTPQTIKWPDGAVGTLNITYNGDWTVSTASATYTGAGGYAVTVTQPTITYDVSGNATLIPELTVA